MLSEDKQWKKSGNEGKKPGKERKRLSGQYGVIKKDKEEEKTGLAKLAAPKVFEVPNVKLQQTLVEKLEKAFKKKSKTNKKSDKPIPDKFFGLCFLGAIELKQPDSGEVKFKDLINNAQLINLKSIRSIPLEKQEGLVGHSLLTQNNFFDLVKGAGLEQEIIENTLSTMGKAGQLDYLQENELVNEDWSVLIEVHYYRDRPTNSYNLHKDTLGQTLFVNLNYINEEEIAGAEYIINPHTTKEYDEYVAKNMPATVNKHLKEAKEEPKGSDFNVDILPQNSVIAFVDELTHHTTPMHLHRKISANTIAEEYPLIKKAYTNFIEDEKKWHFFSKKKTFLDFLDPKYHNAAQTWFTIMSKADDKEPTYDRIGLANILSTSDIDNLIVKESSNEKSPVYFQYGSASVPKYPNRLNVNPSVQPMQRRMSMLLQENKAPKELPEDVQRRFFRTWVRVVPRAAKLINQ